MGLYNGEKHVAQLWGRHDLHTADRESMFKRTVIDYVVYSIQTGIRLNWGPYIKENHPFSEHAFIEIGNTNLHMHT